MKSKKPLTSNRSFGFLFAAFFALLFTYQVYQSTDIFWGYGWLMLSILLAFLASTFPASLAPLNKVWMKFGDTMGMVVSPLVLGAIFFLLISPIAVIGRLFGRDELRMKKKCISTYWVDRKPPGPSGNTFKNQF